MARLLKAFAMREILSSDLSYRHKKLGVSLCSITLVLGKGRQYRHRRIAGTCCLPA